MSHYQEIEAQGGVQQSDKMKKISVGVRVVGGLCAISLIIVGAVGLIGSPSLIQVADSIFYIIFGILFVIAEIRVAMFLEYFSFLRTPAGLSATYVFVGVRAIGWPWWGYIIMVLAFVPGIFYLISALMCAKLYKEEELQDNNNAPSYEYTAEAKSDKKPLLDPASAAVVNIAAAAASNPAVQQAVIGAAKEQLINSQKPVNPLWTEMKDEGTGVPYYVHKTTGEMSWERPI